MFQPYLPVRCLFRLEKCEPTFLPGVFERLDRFLGVEEIGSWNVVFQILSAEASAPRGTTAQASVPVNASGVQAKAQKFLCIRDDTVDLPMMLHAGSHLPLTGQDALVDMLHLTVKHELTVRGKRFRWVDEHEMDWEIFVGSGLPQAGPKNTVYVSLQMSATRSRAAAPLEVFLSLLPKVVGEDAARHALHFHHAQPATISPLVASNTYNRTHLTLQYVLLFQQDLAAKSNQ